MNIQDNILVVQFLKQLLNENAVKGNYQYRESLKVAISLLEKEPIKVSASFSYDSTRDDDTNVDFQNYIKGYMSHEIANYIVKNDLINYRKGFEFDENYENKQTIGELIILHNNNKKSLDEAIKDSLTNEDKFKREYKCEYLGFDE